jgi:hypothetical protein
MLNKFLSIFYLTILATGCSIPDEEMTAIFRGDSPLYFNKTSITVAESEEDSLTLNLQSQPTADVLIDLAVSDSDELEIEPTQLVFTSENYDTPQTIKMLAKDDCLADGTQNTSMYVSNITSTDTNFSESPDVNVPVTVDDGVDNLPKVVFFQSNDMITSETGTITFFKVKLSCAPTANVNVPLVLDSPSEVEMDKTTLTFTTDNFDIYQSVTVTGLSDCVSDSDKTYTIKSGDVSSTDTRFSRYSASAGSSQIYSLVEGKNLNYPVNDDISLKTPSGSLNMTLDFSPAGHPDQFMSFSANLTCPPPGPVYFSLSFTDVSDDISFSTTNGFAEVVNTSLGITFFSFDSANWSTSQNILIQLSAAATGAHFSALFPTTPYTDSLVHKIKIYESMGDGAHTAVSSSLYQSKILNTNITINSY